MMVLYGDQGHGEWNSHILRRVVSGLVVLPLGGRVFPGGRLPAGLQQLHGGAGAAGSAAHAEQTPSRSRPAHLERRRTSAALLHADEPSYFFDFSSGFLSSLGGGLSAGAAAFGPGGPPPPVRGGFGGFVVTTGGRWKVGRPIVGD